MKIKLSNLLAISALTLGLSACMQSGMDSPPGKYEKTVKSTDAKGTTTERKTSTEVEQNSDGNKKAVIKSTTTKDPKGLMNKTTTNKSTQTIEEERY